MADNKSTSTNNSTGSVSLEATQKLLDQALAQEPTVRTCRDDYGMHTWVKHEETLMEYCSVCHLRKDKWVESKGEIGPVEEITTDDLPKKDDPALNNAQKMPERDLSKVPEHLREHVIKPGEVKNPNGRPKGSRNLTTVVLEALAAKVYTIKNEATGKTTEIDGVAAFAEAILENGIKKKDRETLRMIWEFSDGKPTQQHKIEVNGPKGYQVDPTRESMIHEQFGLYSDRLEVVPVAETLKIAPVEVEQVKTIETPVTTPNPTPVAREVAKTGVIEPQPTHATTNNQPNSGVSQATPSVAGGVREA